MDKLTISPNKTEKKIFLASERKKDNSEMLKFIGGLKMSKNTTFKCEASRSAVSCIIKCEDENEYKKILKQLEDKEEVKYIINPY